MDVIFLHSNEINYHQNMERAFSILKDMVIVNGNGAASIHDAYSKVFDVVSSEYFMMIEGDNFIFPNVANYLNLHEPTKFYTTNKFGIQYEHGGIKIMHTESALEQHNSSKIVKTFEINPNIQLNSCQVVLSEHRFDWSHRNEWVTIAKELFKLYIWGHHDYLNKWLEHEIPRNIWNVVKPKILQTSLSNLFDDLYPNISNLYTEK